MCLTGDCFHGANNPNDQSKLSVRDVDSLGGLNDCQVIAMQRAAQPQVSDVGIF